MMKRLILNFLCSLFVTALMAQTAMQNVYGRHYLLLNGKWNVIVDQYDQGRRMEIYKNKVAVKNEEFYEYSFTGGRRLNVPGDWNSQSPELMNYEGTVWYARHFKAAPVTGHKQFLYFNAVSYRCTVYLNGDSIGTHEGGFTPFQIDVSKCLRQGDNFLAVAVNNKRTVDAIPAMAFDWWNYGGITRDVMLVTVPEVFVKDYFLYLDKQADNLIHAEIALSEPVQRGVTLRIPELNVRQQVQTDGTGKASVAFKVKGLQRWMPEKAKLYDVSLILNRDTIRDQIGFRHIAVDGERIVINGRPQFMRSISFHEEIPQRKGRAFSEADACMLLNEAKVLGVNMIRLAHYPQNEYIVRMAERMGIVLWQEIPVWQGIDFDNKGTEIKAVKMLREMIQRDKNRCAVGFWGVANETKPSVARNHFLKALLEEGKSIDPTRLYVAAFDLAYFNKERQRFEMDDPFIGNLDVVAVNKYMGWYHPWPVTPDKAVWHVATGKPLIISEFGGEALYGQLGDREKASSWSEDYQAKLYNDNLEMFRHIPNLAGVSPWVLFDFRSPFRFQPEFQEGWNRKGLVSDQGLRKKAWYIMRDYYKEKKREYLHEK